MTLFNREIPDPVKERFKGAIDQGVENLQRIYRDEFLTVYGRFLLECPKELLDSHDTI